MLIVQIVEFVIIVLAHAHVSEGFKGRNCATIDVNAINAKM